MSKAAGLIQAVLTLLKADPKDLESISADAEVAKAITQHSNSQRGGEYIPDQHTDGQLHGSATREQVKVGPGQEASGAGAERMIRDYASPARQRGTALYPEPLEQMLDGFGRAVKSLADGVTTLIETQKTLPSQIVEAMTAKAAKKADDEEEEDEEESEVVEINASKKAKSAIRKAKKLIADIETLKSEIEDMEPSAERREKRASCKALQKDLAKILRKALELAYAAGAASGKDEKLVAKAADLKKEIRTIATKADINVVQEEEEDEEEEDEKEKAKKAAKALADAEAAKAAAAAAGNGESDKAKTDDKGHQADRQDPKNGNQAAASKSTEEAISSISKRLEDALTGMGVLQGDLRTVMDVVSGKSRMSTAIPDVSSIAKAKPEEIASVLEQIDDLEDAGQLNSIEVSAAREIAGMAKAVAEGTLPKARLEERLQKSTANVVSIFKGKFPKAA